MWVVEIFFENTVKLILNGYVSSEVCPSCQIVQFVRHSESLW
jgi:hypothetical protein